MNPPTLDIARLHSRDAQFSEQLAQRLAYEGGHEDEVNSTVATIIAAVRARGDAALLEYTNHFDRRDAADVGALEVSQAELQAALARIPSEQRRALESAAARVRSYHEHQLQPSWRYREADGTELGQVIAPMERVGMYVPGGKAAYPSSVLMTAIPAKVAGVDELIMVNPAPEGVQNDTVLAAAAIAGVDRVFAVGGAQAVAALAYGTASIPRVDKIVGPGNIYVAQAKRAVFGQVAIDMIAGPSEISIIADGTAPPEWVAMDLLSQAEHDEDAQAILLSPDGAYLDAVAACLAEQLDGLSRAAIARTSLASRGALIKTESLDEAVAIANRIAPEHLELCVADPEALLPGIRHAGAIFMGRFSSESLGDYCAGPNHVLPTAGTARFSSPLGVYDYQKRSSLIHCSAEGARTLGQIASVLARSEGLEAHARSAEFRLDS